MVFNIYTENGDVFEGLALHKAAFESVVMSLSDKITGEVLYKDNKLPYTMKEYVVYNGTKYYLKNPPTIVRNGMADSTENGFTKYSFEFYHPSMQLFSIPFTDVAIDSHQQQFKAEDKTFQWIGKLSDFCIKVDKNLENTVFTCACTKYEDGTIAGGDDMSEVLSFDNTTIADALKVGYETFKVPFILEDIEPSDSDYHDGKKKYRIRFGKPVKEIFDKGGQPFVFKFGQGLGLKNNSATPKNNKIVTRIAGQGSETNIPYGYPQIEWTGDKTWDFTVNNDPKAKGSYPIYNGIVNGKTVRLVKHPFTRKRLMPSIYSRSVYDRIYNKNPQVKIPLIDYYDADGSYTNPINIIAPSYEHHIFEDIKPSIKGIKYKETPIDELYFDPVPVDKNGLDVENKEWNDKTDEEGNYEQSYFRIVLPRLGFDLYSLAIENEPMVIAIESGECAGCKFEIQVNWEDWKKSFYVKKDEEFVFDNGTKTDGKGNVYIPENSHRNAYSFPLSIESPISVIVKKDTETFGTLMPNIYQQPKKGDKYVFLGISLPKNYITEKEKELDEKMKEYMRENNVYYFEYPLKFDEFFLEQNKDILSQIKTNSLVRFNFANETLALSVKQINIKYGDTPLPEYDIVLTDEVTVVLNSIGQVAQGLSNLGTKVSVMQAYYNKNLLQDIINSKLSRTSNDIAHGEISFDKWMNVKGKPIYDYFLRRDEEDGTSFLTKFAGGIHSADIHSIDSNGKLTYVKGSLEGRGYALYTEPQTGDTYLEVDNIVARKRFVAAVLDIQKETFSAGNINLTNANGTIFRVYAFDDSGYSYVNIFAAPNEKGDMVAIALFDEKAQQMLGDTAKNTSKLLEGAAFFKIYFTRTDGVDIVEDLWHNGDMAKAQTLNLTNQRSWHRVVTSHGVEKLEDGKDYNYIVVSNSEKNITIKDDSGRLHKNIKAFNGALLNSVPQIGDKVVQYGSVTEIKRQGITRLDSSADGTGGLYVKEGIGKLLGTNEQFSAARTPIQITPDNTTIVADKIMLATRNADNEIIEEHDFDIDAYRILANSYSNKLNNDGTCSTTFSISVGKSNSKNADIINVGDIKKEGFVVRAKKDTDSNWTAIALPSSNTEINIKGSFNNYSYINAPKIPNSITIQLTKSNSVVDEYAIPIIVNGTNGKDGTSVSIKGQVEAIYDTMTEFDAVQHTNTDKVFLINKNDKISPVSYHWLAKFVNSKIVKEQATLGDGYIDASGNLVIAVDNGWKNVGRIKGEDGKEGVSYIGTTEYYQWSDDGINEPTGTWTENKIPTQTNPTYRFLWNKEKIHKSNGDDIETDPHVLSKDGKEVWTIKEYYAITSNNVAPSEESNLWTETKLNPSTDYPYLWNKEFITYTDNTTRANIHLIAQRGSDGARGEDGISYVKTEEYYQWGKSGEDAPTGEWTLDKIPVQKDSTYIYLWNYEEVYKSNNDFVKTTPRVLSKDGRGIKDIKEEYQITSTSTTPQASSYWETTMPVPTNEEPYLWNKETITFNTGDESSFSIHLIAQKGVDGTKGEDGDNGISFSFSEGQLIITEQEKNNYTGLNQSVYVTVRDGLAKDIPASIDKIDYNSNLCELIYGNGFFEVTEIKDTNVEKIKLTIHISYKNISFSQIYYIYINRLGSWAFTVQNDTMKTVAGKSFTYVDENGNSFTTDGISTIKQTAEGISSRVTNTETTLTDQGNKIAEQETIISQQAGSIESLATATDELGTAMSSIKQTADNISLKVKKDGSENLLTGTKNLYGKDITLAPSGTLNKTSEGFAFIGAGVPMGVTRYVNLIEIKNITLEGNSKYVLSFLYQGKRGSDMHFYIYSEGEIMKVCSSVWNSKNKIPTQSEDGHSVISISNEQKFTEGWVAFTTTSDFEIKHDVVIIMGRLYNGSQCMLCRPKLEYGDVPTKWRPSDNDDTANLLSTGIDIENELITLTSDVVEVQNNSGEKTFLLDENGKLNVNLLNAQQVVTDGLTAKNIVVQNASIDGLHLTGSSRLGGFAINKSFPWMLYNEEVMLDNGEGKMEESDFRNNYWMRLSNNYISFDYFVNKKIDENEAAYQTCYLGEDGLIDHKTNARFKTLLRLYDYDPIMYQQHLSRREIYIDVEPTPLQNLDDTDDVAAPKHDAIYIEHGSVCGFRPRLRRINVDKPKTKINITKDDYTILIKGTGSADIYLPSHDEIEDGQRVEIRMCSEVHNHIYSEAPKGISNSEQIEINQMRIFIYDAVEEKWWTNTLNG